MANAKLQGCLLDINAAENEHTMPKADDVDRVAAAIVKAIRAFDAGLGHSRLSATVIGKLTNGPARIT